MSPACRDCAARLPHDGQLIIVHCSVILNVWRRKGGNYCFTDVRSTDKSVPKSLRRAIAIKLPQSFPTGLTHRCQDGVRVDAALRLLRRTLLLASSAGAAWAHGALTLAAAADGRSDRYDRHHRAPRLTTTARDEQRLAPNLVNIQAAEDIVKYPDFNAAEALGPHSWSQPRDRHRRRSLCQRFAGIDSNLNGTTFGGVTLLNTQPGGTYFGGGGRAVELDTIPIGSIDRLDRTQDRPARPGGRGASAARSN